MNDEHSGHRLSFITRRFLPSSTIGVLVALAVLSAAVYGAIAWLSSAFAFETPEQQRPIRLVLALFAGSFLFYLLAVWVAARCKVTWWLVWAIVLPAIVFRALLLPTPPIQEIDIYRYVWDGAATARAINPYRFSPMQVLAIEEAANVDETGRRLAELRDSSPALRDALERIHFAGLPTCYPPVSQAVFAVGDWLTPSKASVDARVTLFKAILLLFDLATIPLVWLLLVSVGKHPGYVVAYAWCPLVIKEVANSGHLDSIAVFLTTAAVVGVVKLLATNRDQGRVGSLVGAAVLLALAIGAKLYAVVLAPLFAIAIVRKCGLRSAALFVAVAAMLSAACLAPQLATAPAVTPTASWAGPVPESGLKAFLTRWEMNDFCFMLAIENLNPVDVNSTESAPWFAVVPDAWRRAVLDPLAVRLAVDRWTASFLVTRAWTTGVFLAVALAFAWRVYRISDINFILEASFLTLAWFWLLSPTQNPWYWTWALPLLPFARGRAWYAMSGLVMLYYLRFWLKYHFPVGPVLGINYTGTQFFDFVVTWVEYAPWYIWLTVAWYLRRRKEMSVV